MQDPKRAVIGPVGTAASSCEQPVTLSLIDNVGWGYVLPLVYLLMHSVTYLLLFIFQQQQQQLQFFVVSKDRKNVYEFVYLFGAGYYLLTASHQLEMQV